MTLTCIILSTSVEKAQAAFDSCAFAEETLLILNDTMTNYAEVRNNALARAQGDWVLFVDDDEVVTEELADEVKANIQNGEYDAFYLLRTDTFMGRTLRYGETAHTKFLRLAKHGFGSWKRPVHEVWVGKGRVGLLHNHLKHNPHPTISSFLTKINRYSELNKELKAVWLRSLSTQLPNSSKTIYSASAGLMESLGLSWQS
jgi:glycosyltransferase involved in cell wall biosynthesis